MCANLALHEVIVYVGCIDVCSAIDRGITEAYCVCQKSYSCVHLSFRVHLQECCVTALKNLARSTIFSYIGRTLFHCNHIIINVLEKTQRMR